MSVTADVVGDPGAVGTPEIAARSPLELFWRRLRSDRVALVALGVIVFFVAIAIAAPLIRDLVGAPHYDIPDKGALDQTFGVPTGPSGKHFFGVDKQGRDIFVRVLYGLQVSLLVAVLSTGISLVIGVVVGLLAGFYRGWVDQVLSRILDVFLAFPVLLLAIGISSSCSLGAGCLGGLMRPGVVTVVIVIAFAGWTYIGRIVRGQVLSLREKEFVEAARSLGASNRRIIFSHLLPNLVAPLIVYTSLLIPSNILFEAALSFLGVGVQDPRPSLGSMISDATQNFDTSWWFLFFPGVALVLLVLAFNLIGDGLQDALNPKTSK